MTCKFHPSRLTAAQQQTKINRLPRPAEIRGMEKIAHVGSDPEIVRIVRIDRRAEERAAAARSARNKARRRLRKGNTGGHQQDGSDELEHCGFGDWNSKSLHCVFFD